MKQVLGAIVALLVVVSSCAGRKMSATELVAWVRDPANGLVDSVQSGPYVISMQYLPQRMLEAAVRARADMSAPGGQQNGSREGSRVSGEGAGLVVFELSIRSVEQSSTSDPVFADVTDHDAFTLRMQSLAFTIADNVTLILGDRSVRCVSAVFQQDIGLRTKRMIRLVFPVGEAELSNVSEASVRWSDHDFGTGISVFRCATAALNNLPSVQ